MYRIVDFYYFFAKLCCYEFCCLKNCYLSNCAIIFHVILWSGKIILSEGKVREKKISNIWWH